MTYSGEKAIVSIMIDCQIQSKLKKKKKIVTTFYR